MFDTPKAFLKEFFEKVDFEKKSADDKKTGKITLGQGVKRIHILFFQKSKELTQLKDELQELVQSNEVHNHSFKITLLSYDITAGSYIASCIKIN